MRYREIFKNSSFVRLSREEDIKVKIRYLLRAKSLERNRFLDLNGFEACKS